MRSRSIVNLSNTPNWGQGIVGLTGDELCLQLTRGYLSLISREDVEAFGSYNWSANLSSDRQVRAVRNTPKDDQGKQKTIYLHREISKPLPGEEVDHRDQHCHFVHKIVDNRRHNLRNVSKSQNNANRRKTRGTSQYKGVCWNKQTEKWRALIMVNLRNIHLGSFTSEVEAAVAYDQSHEHYWPGITEGLNRTMFPDGVK